MILVFVLYFESLVLNKFYWVFGLKVNLSKFVIENLVFGVQYQVVMYLRKGFLIGLFLDFVIFVIGKFLVI